MALAATVLTLLSALEHVYFFVLESVLWKKPLGLKTFRMDAAKAETTAQLAVNQGFYNLFLAAGLLYAALAAEPVQTPLRIYTLGFVVAAAIVGGVTVNLRILMVQGIPAALALALTLLR
jgi:putative membrane protein